MYDPELDTIMLAKSVPQEHAHSQECATFPREGEFHDFHTRVPPSGENKGGNGGGGGEEADLVYHVSAQIVGGSCYDPGKGPRSRKTRYVVARGPFTYDPVDGAD